VEAQEAAATAKVATAEASMEGAARVVVAGVLVVQAGEVMEEVALVVEAQEAAATAEAARAGAGMGGAGVEVAAGVVAVEEEEAMVVVALKAAATAEVGPVVVALE
jgi:hypothetical protein